MIEVATAVSGFAAPGVAAWLQLRGRRQRDRELSLREYARTLPAGSLIVDRGRQGLVIEVGQRKGGAGGVR
ncbi:hypothetical protein [Kitasatospora sp. NPDC094015]|uniref:hypothetical protein n=1 Tax=Kitasatospora sp. NPDC094015 TaxID=3155205 RepID=UPI0033164E0D